MMLLGTTVTNFLFARNIYNAIFEIMILAVWQPWSDMVGNGVSKLCNLELMTHAGIPVLCVLHLM
jgi:hypothetical protein